MKKIIASVLTATMLMLTVASCSDSNATTEGNEFGLLENGVINVATSPDYPPFEYIDGNEIAGFDIELLNAVAEISGLEVKFSPLDFDTIITAVQAGQFDMGMSSFTQTEERSSSVLFGDTYYYSAQVALLPLDSEVKSVEDLKDKKIGAGMGTTGELAARTLSDDIQLVVTSVGFPMIVSNQLDAYICDIGVAENAILTGNYKLLETPISEEKIAMIFKSDNTVLADELNKSLATFMESPEYKSLLEKYELN